MQNKVMAYRRHTISLPREVSDFVRGTDLNLSKFCTRAIKKEMEGRGYKFPASRHEKKKPPGDRLEDVRQEIERMKKHASGL